MSFVYIEQEVESYVDPVLIKTLNELPSVEIRGIKLVFEDLLTINAVTGRHQRKEGQQGYHFEQLNPGIERIPTSLRYNRGLELPILCMHEIIFDRYVNVVALAEYGFEFS